MYVHYFALRGTHLHAKMRRASSRMLKKSARKSCLFGLFGFLAEKN